VNAAARAGKVGATVGREKVKGVSECVLASRSDLILAVLLSRLEGQLDFLSVVVHFLRH
jgi:hypothetical protein